MFTQLKHIYTGGKYMYVIHFYSVNSQWTKKMVKIGAVCPDPAPLPRTATIYMYISVRLCWITGDPQMNIIQILYKYFDELWIFPLIFRT